MLWCNRRSSVATDSRTRSWSTRCWPRSRRSGARCRYWPFAAASLWERRDREHGLLTRRGLQGDRAGRSRRLAQHAEATLERIGAESQPLVREIFRNLVTAKGTRASRDYRMIYLSVGLRGSRGRRAGAPSSSSTPDC